MMKTIGIVLLILGLVALVYGGISYSNDRSVLDVGSVQITASEGNNVPIAAIVGGVVLIGGVALMVMGSRRPGRAM